MKLHLPSRRPWMVSLSPSFPPQVLYAWKGRDFVLCRHMCELSLSVGYYSLHYPSSSMSICYFLQEAATGHQLGPSGGENALWLRGQTSYLPVSTLPQTGFVLSIFVLAFLAPLVWWSRSNLNSRPCDPLVRGPIGNAVVKRGFVLHRIFWELRLLVGHRVVGLSLQISNSLNMFNLEVMSAPVLLKHVGNGLSESTTWVL